MNGNSEYVDGRYGRIALLSNDSGAVTESLRRYGEWAENELHFLRQFLQIGSVALDVGAYIGTHTLALAQAVGPAGRVIAFEAQPATFQVLELNVASKGLSFGAAGSGIVQLEHAVVADEIGQVMVPVLDVEEKGSFGSASLLAILSPVSRADNLPTKPEAGKAIVRAVTIDSLQLVSCSLIKLDVEGVEDLVLRGSGETLGRCLPVVYCECNSLEQGLKTLSVMRAHGLATYGHVVDAFNPDNYFGELENVFGEAREVALVGIPELRLSEIDHIDMRPTERLLKIEDADDLALALLNKPQYPIEVLRVSAAARTGGSQFLDHYQGLQLNVVGLQTEIENLRIARNTELRDFESRLETSRLSNQSWAEEKQRELLSLHDILAVRDQAIRNLQDYVSDRDQTIKNLQEFSSERDQTIKGLQESVLARNHAVENLENALSEANQEVRRKEEDIAEGQRQIRLAKEECIELSSRLNSEIATLKQLVENQAINLKRAACEADSIERELALKAQTISSLLSSKSWQVTGPLRWAMRLFR